jgi:hypothetical protein
VLAPPEELLLPEVVPLEELPLEVPPSVLFIGLPVPLLEELLLPEVVPLEELPLEVPPSVLLGSSSLEAIALSDSIRE